MTNNTHNLAPGFVQLVKRIPCLLLVGLMLAVSVTPVASQVPTTAALPTSDLALVRAYDANQDRKIDLSEKFVALQHFHENRLSIRQVHVIYDFENENRTLPPYPQGYTAGKFINEEIFVPYWPLPVASLDIRTFEVSGASTAATVAGNIELQQPSSLTGIYSLEFSGSAVAAGGYFADLTKPLSTSRTQQFRFAPGETSKPFRLTGTTVLSVFDEPQTLTIQLKTKDRVDETAVLRVIPPLANVHINRLTTGTIKESSYAKFRVSVTPAVPLDKTLAVRVRIKRGPNSDVTYQTITIPGGASHKDFSVTPENQHDDPHVSQLEVLVVAHNQQYQPVNPQQANVAFIDNEPIHVTINGSTHPAAEGETRRFDVELSRPLQQDEAVRIYLDYQGPNRLIHPQGKRGQVCDTTNGRTLCEIVTDDDYSLSCGITPGVTCNQGQTITFTGSENNSISTAPIYIHVLEDQAAGEQDWLDVNFASRSHTILNGLIEGITTHDNFKPIQLKGQSPPVVLELAVSDPIIEDDEDTATNYNKFTVTEGEYAIVGYRAIGYQVYRDEPVEQAWIIQTAIRPFTTSENGEIIETTAQIEKDFEFGPAYIPSGRTMSAGGGIRLIDDDIIESTEHLTIGIPGYPDEEFTITILDDDQARLTLPDEDTAKPVRLNYGTTYAFALDSRTTKPVAVHITLDSTSNYDGKVEINSPSTLTFTPKNWNTPQTVTITGKKTGTTTITHTIISQDQHYQHAKPQDLRINITKPDVLVPIDLYVAKVNDPSDDDDRNIYQVSLAAPPTSNVIIKPFDDSDSGSSTSERLRIETTALTFTPTNWATPQTVRFFVPSQSLHLIGHYITTSDKEYDALHHRIDRNGNKRLNKYILVQTADINIFQRNLVTEGEYLIFVSPTPREPVTIRIESGNPSIATPSPSTITFRPEDSVGYQTVRVIRHAEGDTTFMHTSESKDLLYDQFQDIRNVEIGRNVGKPVN